jgi:dienelactone hydrolase
MVDCTVYHVRMDCTDEDKTPPLTDAPQPGNGESSAGPRHRKRRPCAGLKSMAFAFGLLASAGFALAQERTMVPVTVDGEEVRLAVTSHKPPGDGPFPTLIFHHGSTGGGTDPSLFAQLDARKSLVDWFTSRGWAVVLPARRGRGGSEGLYDEGFSDDRAQGYSCNASRLLWGAERALRDVNAITAPILALPFVDKARVAVGGHSRGGILALMWAGQHPDQSRAVVNFGGGWRATVCASAEVVNQELFRRNPARVPPSLWLYGTHDPYYSMAHSRANFAAFEAAGGVGAFHEYQPPPGRSHGHFIIDFPLLWGGTMERYLTGRGLPTKAP